MAKIKCWVDKEGDDFVAHSPHLAIKVKGMSFSGVKDKMVVEIVRLAECGNFEITSYDGEIASHGIGYFGISMDENVFKAMRCARDSLIRQERMERGGKKSISEMVHMISLGVRDTLEDGKNIGIFPAIGSEVVHGDGYITDKVIGHNKDGSIEVERTIRLDRSIEYVSMTMLIPFNIYED